ncbi:hypothetical protein [Natronorarus salvus]|uniref:hypothetical protein n=1 Tax=Natronorarus salvus TaxID=3117733 RepID=UPI002F26207A
MARRFGARVDVTRPDPTTEGAFLVRSQGSVDHDEFMGAVLTFLGTADRLVVHHRSGIAVVRLSYGQARRLRGHPMVSLVGSVGFDPDRFAAVTGIAVDE